MNVRAARIAPPEAEVRLAPKADWSLIGRLVPYAKPHSFLFGATLAMVPLASGAALFQSPADQQALKGCRAGNQDLKCE